MRQAKPQSSFPPQVTSIYNMIPPSTRGTCDRSQVGAKRHTGSCRVPDTLCTLAHTAKPSGSIIVEVRPKIFADLWFASCSCKRTEVESSLPQNQP